MYVRREVHRPTSDTAAKPPSDSDSEAVSRAVLSEPTTRRFASRLFYDGRYQDMSAHRLPQELPPTLRPMDEGTVQGLLQDGQTVWLEQARCQ